MTSTLHTLHQYHPSSYIYIYSIDALVVIVMIPRRMSECPNDRYFIDARTPWRDFRANGAVRGEIYARFTSRWDRSVGRSVGLTSRGVVGVMYYYDPATAYTTSFARRVRVRCARAITPMVRSTAAAVDAIASIDRSIDRSIAGRSASARHDTRAKKAEKVDRATGGPSSSSSGVVVVVGADATRATRASVRRAIGSRRARRACVG